MSQVSITEIHELVREGMSQRKIAAKLGISRDLVRMMLSKDPVVSPVVNAGSDEKIKDVKPVKLKKNVTKAIRSKVTKGGLVLKLKRENDFLRWWMMGERNGWVDQLLEELKV